MFNFKEMFERLPPTTVATLGTIWFIFASLVMFGFVALAYAVHASLPWIIASAFFACAHAILVVILLKHVWRMRKIITEGEPQ
jgi:membrane protein YdbS with pleckstrin-like domain